jgi:hypothetical protein
MASPKRTLFAIGGPQEQRNEKDYPNVKHTTEPFNNLVTPKNRRDPITQPTLIDSSENDTKIQELLRVQTELNDISKSSSCKKSYAVV